MAIVRKISDYLYSSSRCEILNSLGKKLGFHVLKFLQDRYSELDTKDITITLQIIYNNRKQPIIHYMTILAAHIVFQICTCIWEWRRRLSKLYYIFTTGICPYMPDHMNEIHYFGFMANHIHFILHLVFFSPTCVGLDKMIL